MSNSLHIEVTSPDGGTLGSYPIQAQTLRIGRDPSAEISITTGGGGTVSWEHAVVESDERGALRVRDVGSTNGTYLNGSRIETSQAFGEGDVLRLGQQGPTLVVRSNTASPNAAPVANLHQPGSNQAGNASPFGYYQQPGHAPAPEVGAAPKSAQPAPPVPAHHQAAPSPQSHQAPQSQPSPQPHRQPAAQPRAVAQPQAAGPSLPASKSSGGTTRLMMIKMQQQSNMRWLIASSVALIIVVGIGIGVFVLTRPQQSPDSDEAVQALIERIEKSVVTVEVVDINGNTGNGSGFLYGDSGIIVTNFHVIDQVESARVVFPDQSEVEVEGFLAADQGRDVAILKIKPPADLPEPLKLVAKRPRKSARVFAIGSPKGFQGSVTSGSVGAYRDGEEVAEQLMTPVTTESGQVVIVDVYADVKNYDRNATWVETDARILPGNSGGPLVNLQGEVVGINTFFYASMSGDNDIHGTINFASSFENIQDTLKHMSTEPRPLTSAWR